MEYVIAVFRSRKETLDLRAKLEKVNIMCFTINTPIKVKIGCGISLKFDARGLPYVRTVIQHNSYNTFIGFYQNDKYNKLEKVEK